ncbi:uncharacterized protein LOC62_05G007224 [Vanrija pseudolonga]|uniref:Uncharacterized protein n=1 Tax=Vanrija pseudolonga TaxID=143232 RepID=A0AAF0YD11_9TREE|nr:hypothetical protein LOC62_05G007224 [Vanrija pseudolonga]
MASKQYDVFQPSALPSASLGRRSARPIARNGLEAAAAVKTPDSELDRVSEAWNARIDKEVKAVASGLGELVELADITSNPPTDADTLPPLHLKLKTAALIRAAQTLRDTAHELRLALLLGSDNIAAVSRDTEAAALRREADALRRAVAAEFAGMRGGADGVVPGVVGETADDGGEKEPPVDSGEKQAETETVHGEPAAEVPAPDTHMDVDGADDDDDEDDFEEVA